MTSRSMTYDLDGVFQTRNQGQLISSTQTQRKMIRTPGLVPMKKTLAGYVASKAYNGQQGLGTDYLDAAQNWFAPDDSSGQSGMGDINLPLIGTISTTTAALAVVGLGLAGLLIYLKVKKSRKAA